MAFKLLPFGLAKRVNPISVTHVIDCSYLATVEASPTLDLPRLGGFFGNFTHIGPANALNLKQSYLLKRPEALNFPGLLIVDPQTQVIRINQLEIPARESIELIPEADVLADNLLLNSATTASDALDDGLAFFEIKILSEGFLLAHVKIVICPLDDGLVFSSVEIIDVSDYEQALGNAIIADDVFNGNAVLAPSEIFGDLLDDGLLFDKPTISPIKLMARSRTIGKDWRSRYVPKVDEQAGPQLRLPGPVSECRHGCVRSKCPACLKTSTKPTPKRPQRQPQVVDVFEQLFYILQPPILPAQGQPLIFPNGHKPYPFQIGGVKWLVEHESALLADEMGLGKTIQAIIALRILFRRGELQRTLVVCPASMTNTWEREIKSWAPELRVFRLQGDRAARLEAWKSHAEIYVVSYETLRNDIREFDVAKFDLCILDEAQKIKNPGTKIHRVAKLLTPKYRWALTGTPLENSADDVIALFSFLKPGLFHEDNSGWNYLSQVPHKIKPYTLRRTIDEVALELPEITRQEHWLDLLPEQSRAYRAMEDHEMEALKLLGVDATRVHVFALITKLKQLCNYDDSSGESCKLNFLEDELDGLSESGEKALVFSQYPEKTLKVIEPRLRQYKPLIYHGSMSGNKRDEVVRRFEEDEANGVLLMSLKAGGVGLTLTRANHVFLYDHWWSPAVMDQAVGRVRRIGQERPVFSHSLYAVGTIEERIHNLLKKKRALFQEMFDQGPATDVDALNRLTDEDLFGLFGLDTPGDDKESPKPVMQEQKPNEPLVEFPREPQPVKANRPRPWKFSRMSPTEFEEAIRDLFNELGYTLTLTKQSHDGGIDLDGYRNGIGGGRIVVQCKRYKGTVSESAVRDLFGVVSASLNIEQGFLVTTGRFSRNATDFAVNKRLTLFDGEFLEYLRASLRSLDRGPRSQAS